MTDRGLHHQRRPPDVEEALSSMLWTPYEHSTTTDSSSDNDDDDDERLNKQLCKSPSRSLDYHRAPTAFVPLSGATYFGASPDDLLLPAAIAPTGRRSSTTPFVPFSSVRLSAGSGESPPAHAAAIRHNKNDGAVEGTFRFSYPYYGPIPSLNKWWSSSSSSKEPPSYESLYSRSTPRSRISIKSASRRNAKPAIATISSSRQALSPIDIERLDDATAPLNPFGRLVHSFTDNFVTEFPQNYSCSSLQLSPQLSLSSSATLPEGALRHAAVASCSSDDVTEAEVQQRGRWQQQLAGDRHRLAELESQAANAARKANETNVRSQQSEENYNSNYNNNNNNNSNNNNNNNSDYNKNHIDCITQDQSEYGEVQRSLTHDEVEGGAAVDADEESGVGEGAKEVSGDREQVSQPVSFAGESTTTTTTNKTASRTTRAESQARGEEQRRVNSTTPTMNGALSQCVDGRRRRRSWRTGSFVESTTRDDDERAANAPTTSIHSFSFHSPCVVDAFIHSSTVGASGLHRLSRAPFEQHFEKTLPADSSSSSSITAAHYSLTPNKCLAELERLYAEFRASESLVVERRNSSATSASAMRLNVPPTVADGATTTVVVAAAATPTTSTHGATGTSSVFLTPTNSVTTNGSSSSSNSCSGGSSGRVAVADASSNRRNNNNNNISHPCHRQPSLTIQVNNNSDNCRQLSTAATGIKNDSNNNNNSNNNGGVSVSVVKCSYVRPSDSDQNNNANNNNHTNNNNNNNNRSNYNCNNINNNNDEVINNNDDDNSRESAVSSVSVYSSSSSVPNVVYSDRSHVAAPRSRHVATATATATASTTTTTAIGEESVSVISVNNPTKSVASALPPNQSTSMPMAMPTQMQTRTFASTQCQTDDFEPVQLRAERPSQPPPIQPAAMSSREQRRRERRERRHHQQQLQQHQQHQHQQQQQQQQQQLSLAAANHRRHPERHSLPPVPALPMTHLHPPHMHHHHHHQLPPPNATMPAAMSAMLRPMLPDILHSHFPPPYSALPLNASNCGGGGGGGGAGSGIGIGSGSCPPVPPPSMIGPPPPPVAPPPGATLLTPVISTVPIPGAAQIVSDGRFTLPLPIIRRSPSERSGKGCCGQWFAGPPLRALIAVVALGGVACALGGAALGATGLAGPPSSHLTAALLMIGVGVVLVTVSGAAWRMTAPGGPPCLGLGSSVDLGRCGRRPCSRGGGAPHGLLYPEFQHRPPPPSYQASMQEYRLRLLLLDRDRQNGVVRGNSPPPTYRSHAGSLLRAPLTTTIRGAGSSSIGGSEYSLPPSYRSRNTTPATVCSERSIETAPSGRLLANEDIPEPLSVDQLHDYRAAHLQRSTETRIAAGASKAPRTNARLSNHHQVRTSAIVEIEACHESVNDGDVVIGSQPSEKLNPRVFGVKERSCVSGGKELVTIVTISQSDRIDVSNDACASSAGTDQIEILAHL